MRPTLERLIAATVFAAMMASANNSEAAGIDAAAPSHLDKTDSLRAS